MFKKHTLFLKIILLLFAAPLLAEEPSMPATEELSPSSMEATQSYENAFLKMLATLGILLFLLLFSFWCFRRLAQGRLLQMNSSKAIKILEKRSLSPKSILYVVEFSGKRLLVAESQLEVRKIDESTLSPTE